MLLSHTHTHTHFSLSNSVIALLYVCIVMTIVVHGFASFPKCKLFIYFAVHSILLMRDSMYMYIVQS